MIVGSGIGGLCAAIQLKRLGVTELTILERAGEVGGTWHANRYPGVAVDTSILNYSLSFDPDPGWSRLYAGGPELQAYLVGLSHRYSLREHIKFGVTVEQLAYDEAAGEWAVDTVGGESFRAQIVVSATGVLSNPAIPDITGLDSFEGRILHSAEWDSGFEAGGRRIAQIGSGATAAQLVPELAEDAEMVHVFQRSAPWVLPRDDRPIGKVEAAAHRRLPWLLKVRRWRRFWLNDRIALGFERQDRTIERQEAIAKAFIERSIADPELRRLVLPDYSIGCKRRVMSDDWYPALQRPNVELVPHELREVRPRSVVGGDGTEREVDTIVFSTGFRVRDLVPMKVFGVAGEELHDAWADGAASYLGLSVHGFPNLFFVMGPNTGIGSGSATFMIEAQVRYITSAVDQMRRHRLHSVDVRREVQAAAYDEVQSRLAGSVYGSGCVGWYQSPNGKIDTLWPGLNAEYWWRTRRFKRSLYHCRPVRSEQAA
ncbi:MAG: NAD(P)/FAD-dependent oxidoreductase [Glycomyces artemisiae]|uniref:NAD(P)/FAD-dependent oxidoreductase n=1 Tax=Glycomyces artemisiae TaxID=1076443 RepID=A0A850C2F7_9ACTN|nr:NAD(P)/FAD-dependent oxidoreductase [Glycomyces artemisiae]